MRALLALTIAACCPPPASTECGRLHEPPCPIIGIPPVPGQLELQCSRGEPTLGEDGRYTCE